MKKYLLAILCFLLSFSISAQVILIEINLGDCVKCKIVIDNLIRNTPNEIPVYFVFPNDSYEYKTEIIEN